MRTALRNLAVIASAASLWQSAGVAQASNSDALNFCTPYPQQCFNCTTFYAKLHLNNCIKLDDPAFPFKIKLNGYDLTRYARFCGDEVTLCIRKDRGLNIGCNPCCENNRWNTLYAEGYEEVTCEKFSTVVFFTVTEGRRRDGVSFNGVDSVDISGLDREPLAIDNIIEAGWYRFTDLMNQAADLAPTVSTSDEMGPPADVIS